MSERFESNQGWAQIDGSKTIGIPYVKDELSFIICLHEIGHIVKNMPNDRTWLAEYEATKFVFDECKKLKIKLSKESTDTCINYLRHILIQSLSKRKCLNSLSIEILQLLKINKYYWNRQLRRGKKPKMVGPIGFFEVWGKCRLRWI